MYKIAYLVSHPIQYQAPLLREIAARPDISLHVFFLSDFSVRDYKDPGFGTAIQWDVPLLDGYEHTFLPAIGGADKVTATRPISTGLGQLLKQGKFDALWMHGYAHPVNIRALFAARRHGIPVLVRAESQMGSAARPRGLGRLKEALIRRLLAKVDGFLAIGTLNSHYYQHYGVPAEKIFPVPYAVDNKFFQHRADDAVLQKENLRSELGLSSDRPIILYASKFVERKRAGDLLDAYLKLSPDGIQEPHPYLLMIGDGEQRPELEEKARGTGWTSIKFLGFKNQTELPAYFGLCDVFVLVSEREPWGLIVNEVMNASKAVIVSDQVGSATDLVRDGVNGYVVRTGDVATLAMHLREITDNPELARRMGTSSREIIDNWSYQQDVEGLLAAMNFVKAKASKKVDKS